MTEQDKSKIEEMARQGYTTFDICHEVTGVSIPEIIRLAKKATQRPTTTTTTFRHVNGCRGCETLLVCPRHGGI